jgi:HEAT repeat protein
MFRSLLIAGALLSTGPEGKATQTAEPPAAADGCTSLSQCLERIRDTDSRVLRGDSVIYRDIVQFGAPAVDALVPMLTDPDLNIRERAGYLLAQFPSVDPRHLPALVEAWRHGDTINHQGRGNGWLPRAIAATGTDEALRLLWADYERDPEQGSNSQTFFALAWGFPERVRPLLLARIAACRESDGAGIRDGNYRGPCAGIYTLLQEFRPPFPAWSTPAILDLAQHARSDDVRAGAEDTLAGFSNPAALALLQRRLAALPHGPGTERRWEVSRLIMQIVRYGAAAQASGPAIIPYLDAAYDEDLRADAALALGQIEAPSAARALLALARDLADDWLLAYNVAESLGRLHVAAARPLLERLASDYWHRGVRNNAARALNMIAGGRFENLAASASGASRPPPRDGSGEELMYTGRLRFTGDDASSPCIGSSERPLVQDPVGMLRGPRIGVALVSPTEMSTAARGALRRAIPVRFAQGQVVFALPTPDGELVGLNGGEFGGGLIVVDEQGEPQQVFGEPVAFAWQMGGRLYVAAGLAHLVLDTGHLYVVDPARHRIDRTIRLPASPQHLYATRDGAVIGTAAGQVAIRQDGQLVDPERMHGCMVD